MSNDTPHRYAQIVEQLFTRKYRPGDRLIAFTREDITSAARELLMQLPSNLGDVLYGFRFRMALPESIEQTAPEGERWVIELARRGKYAF